MASGTYGPGGSHQTRVPDYVPPKPAPPPPSTGGGGAGGGMPSLQDLMAMQAAARQNQLDYERERIRMLQAEARRAALQDESMRRYQSTPRAQGGGMAIESLGGTTHGGGYGRPAYGGGSSFGVGAFGRGGETKVAGGGLTPGGYAPMSLGGGTAGMLASLSRYDPGLRDRPTPESSEIVIDRAAAAQRAAERDRRSMESTSPWFQASLRERLPGG
jgi:hypothetical protein